MAFSRYLQKVCPTKVRFANFAIAFHSVLALIFLKGRVFVRSATSLVESKGYILYLNLAVVPRLIPLLVKRDLSLLGQFLPENFIHLGKNIRHLYICGGVAGSKTLDNVEFFRKIMPQKHISTALKEWLVESSPVLDVAVGGDPFADFVAPENDADNWLDLLAYSWGVDGLDASSQDEEHGYEEGDRLNEI